MKSRNERLCELLPAERKRAYLVDVHVLSDGGTDVITETVDDVNDTRRETSFVSVLGEELGTQGSDFRGLENDGVTGRESRADFPCEHEN